MLARVHFLFLLAALPLIAQPAERLGTVSFPVSCSASSQAHFNRGVALLHDFWYEEARAEFDRISAADPSCAMAHWGAALSSFHQIWNRPSPANMQYGWSEMQKAKSLVIGTAREQAYIQALVNFYQPGSETYPARIAAYSKQLAALYANYPDDADAGAFYALSLLAAKSPDDASVAQEQKALAVLKPLFAKYPDNPGLVHYIVHACDNPTLASEGLAAADHYLQIAQSGPHAYHMPGHIYARLGLWPQDIASQLGSIKASESAETRGLHGMMDEPHSYDFLLYAYLQNAEDDHARSALLKSAEPLNMIAAMPGMDDNRMAGMVSYYRAKLQIFYSLELRDWQSAAAVKVDPSAPPEATTLVFWAHAIAHGRLRQPQLAAADLASYDKVNAELRQTKPYLADGTGSKIERSEILSWIAFAGGKQEAAITNMRAAADLQDKVGQAEVDIPAREMLADILLEFDHPEKALAEYETALKLSPNRLNGLYNAGRAAEACANTQKAQLYYTALLKSTSNGQYSSRPEFSHARNFVGANK